MKAPVGRYMAPIEGKRGSKQSEGASAGQKPGADGDQ